MSEADVSRINDESLDLVSGGATARVKAKTTFAFVKSGPGENFDSVYKVQSGDTVETTGVRQDQGGKIWCELAGGGWIEESLLTVIE